MHLTAAELHRRLLTLDRCLATRADLLETRWPLMLEPRAWAAELEDAEARLGVTVPEPLRTLLTRISGAGSVAYQVRAQAVGQLEAPLGTGGGFELLSPARMLAERERLADLPATAGRRFLPFARAPEGDSWLVIVRGRRGTAVMPCSVRPALHQAWHLHQFFNGWSRAGFPVTVPWTAQPPRLVELFEAAMGLAPCRDARAAAHPRLETA